MVKEINDSNDYTYFIDKYYDIKTSKNYIITSNFGNVKSYDFNKSKRYHKYYDKNKNRHFSIAIDSNENIIKLFESSCDGNIRIWNFHSSELLKKIKVCDNLLYGICIWNNKYLFVGCDPFLNPPMPNSMRTSASVVPKPMPNIRLPMLPMAKLIQRT